MGDIPCRWCSFSRSQRQRWSRLLSDVPFMSVMASTDWNGAVCIGIEQCRLNTLSSLLCVFRAIYGSARSQIYIIYMGTYIGGFTDTSYAVSCGHPAPLVGKRLLAGGLRVYFCLDSCLVYINFAHTQDHDYVLYLCGGTSGIVWTARFSFLSSKKNGERRKLVECVQL